MAVDGGTVEIGDEIADVAEAVVDDGGVIVEGRSVGWRRLVGVVVASGSRVAAIGVGGCEKKSG